MNSEDTSRRLHEAHRRRLINMRDEARLVVATASRLSEAISELLGVGGKADLRGQLSLLTDRINRLHKDWGAIEALQEAGAKQPPPSRFLR